MFLIFYDHYTIDGGIARLRACLGNNLGSLIIDNLTAAAAMARSFVEQWITGNHVSSFFGSGSRFRELRAGKKIRDIFLSFQFAAADSFGGGHDSTR